MRNSAFFPLLAILFTLTMVFSAYDLVNTHEKIHQIIFNDYGIDSYITWSFTKASTIPYNTTLAVQQCTDSCLLAHSINEVVGYNILIILSLIFSIGMILILYFSKMAIDKEHEQKLFILKKRLPKHE